jgi:hypothetical protein
METRSAKQRRSLIDASIILLFLMNGGYAAAAGQQDPFYRTPAEHATYCQKQYDYCKVPTYGRNSHENFHCAMYRSQCLNSYGKN